MPTKPTKPSMLTMLIMPTQFTKPTVMPARPHRFALTLLILSMIGLTLPITTASAQPQNADLPLTNAVLFSSGVGYFEHQGQITPPADAPANVRIMFKTDQINDVLKSMIVMSHTPDGQPASVNVTYAANEPIERALRSFGVDLSANPSLPDMLRQLRGAELRLTHAGETTLGRILHVETVIESSPEHPDMQRPRHTLQLVTDAGIITVPMDSISTLELTDAKLRDELNKAMQLLVASRDTNRKPVDIALSADANAPLNTRIGYLVETPVWKTSYRLDLTDRSDKNQNDKNDNSNHKNKSLLQGWAIVENTSDNDWQNVRLTLASGSPISFIQDLYTPRYLKRPVIAPPVGQPIGPVVYDGGISPAPTAAPMAMESAAIAGRFAGKADMAEQKRERQIGLRSNSIAEHFNTMGTSIELTAQASSQQVGELFQFTIDSPVNLARRQSAMLPIINQSIAAEKISIYDANVMPDHPLHGVWLTNDTKLKLLAGPITVYDEGSYAGDARIDHFPENDKRLISYAVDLDLTVITNSKSPNQLSKLSIIEGVLHITRQHDYITEYDIKNTDDQARDLVIQYPHHNAHRKLVTPKTPAEKTANAYRFRVDVPASKTTQFTVHETEPLTETIALLNRPLNQFVWVLESKQIPEKIRAAVAKAASLRQEIARIEQRLNDSRQQLNTIKQGQDRLRENIRTVGQNSALGKRYLTKLNAEEDQIEGLDQIINQLEIQLNTKRHELADYLKNLNVQE